jgi:hypothetical protein
MKKTNLITLTFLILSTLNSIGQETKEIISLYQGSELIYADNIGFETSYYLSEKSIHKALDGKVNRKFCKAPEGISPYEITRNYEKAINSKGGAIIHFSRDANSKYEDNETGESVNFLDDWFRKARNVKTGEYNYEHRRLPYYAKDYVVGKISTSDHDIFISVVAGVVREKTYYEILIVEAESMDMNNVNLNVLNDGITKMGRIAVYDIYFETGKSEVKSESTPALKVIADYLKKNSGRKFLIVGHTDNTGDFDSNIQLSNSRAKAVFEKLVSDYKISAEQLIPHGVGSACPQLSNNTENGKARNRRVELVEL